MKNRLALILAFFCVWTMLAPDADAARQRRYKYKKTYYKKGYYKKKARARHRVAKKVTPIPGYGGVNCKIRPKDEFMCHVCNNYFEAGNQTYREKVKVGRVVLTRTISGVYPKQSCAAIYEVRRNRRGKRVAMFSWTLKRNLRLPRGGKVLQDSIDAAKEALMAGPSGATHYYARYVNPRWARYCTTVDRGPVHTFMKCPDAYVSDEEMALGMAQAEDRRDRYGKSTVEDIQTAAIPMPRLYRTESTEPYQETAAIREPAQVFEFGYGEL